MFQPWIGNEYARTRLLILGESAYSWEEDELIHPPLTHSLDSVNWAIEEFPNAGRFFNMISKALANEETPSRDRLNQVWNRVAFTNYVSGTVGEGARIRPSREMWETASRDFRNEIQAIDPLPTRLIVLGQGMWGNMPETEVHITDQVQGYRFGEHLMMCMAVHHPAGGLSWRELASVLHFTYLTELRA
jgi:hypothetical protein